MKMLYHTCNTIIIGTITILTLIITYFKWKFLYWKRKQIPYLEPSIPFGNSKNPINRKETFSARMIRFYNEFKSKGHKHGGVYVGTMPLYMPVHLDYIKSILIKDFNYFMDRGMYFNEKVDPLSAHLFNIEGQKWRSLRAKLTPTFTSGKMKMMFQTLVDCGVQLQNFIEEKIAKNEPLDTKELLSCYSTDVIGSCAFGIDCNSFKDPDSKFRKYGKKIFKPTKIQIARNFIIFTFPEFSRKIGLWTIPRDLSKFFMDVVNQTVDYREKNNFSRNDFMQLLLEMKNNGEKNTDGEKLTMNEIAAQAFVFFLAGFETSSSAMNFCLYELALNKEYQDKVRDEINTVLDKYNGVVTYDVVSELKYMGQCIDETLRKYPPVPMLPRKCVKNYKIPESDIVIEKGTRIFVPCYPLHHDPEFFPEPEKFDPERFSEENKLKIPQCAFLPFGEGPRICIGLRFGIMQTKVGLLMILRNFRISLSEKVKIPIDFDPNSFLLAPKEALLFHAENI